MTGTCCKEDRTMWWKSWGRWYNITWFSHTFCGFYLSQYTHCLNIHIKLRGGICVGYHNKTRPSSSLYKQHHTHTHRAIFLNLISPLISLTRINIFYCTEHPRRAGYKLSTYLHLGINITINTRSRYAYFTLYTEILHYYERRNHNAPFIIPTYYIHNLNYFFPYWNCGSGILSPYTTVYFIQTFKCVNPVNNLFSARLNRQKSCLNLSHMTANEAWAPVWSRQFRLNLQYAIHHKRPHYQTAPVTCFPLNVSPCHPWPINIPSVNHSWHSVGLAKFL